MDIHTNPSKGQQMLINLSSLLPLCVPCIVHAHDIQYIAVEEVVDYKKPESFLLVKLYSREERILLHYMGTNKDLTPEVMSKAAFAINAAIKPSKGTT